MRLLRSARRRPDAGRGASCLEGSSRTAFIPARKPFADKWLPTSHHVQERTHLTTRETNKLTPTQAQTAVAASILRQPTTESPTRMAYSEELLDE